MVVRKFGVRDIFDPCSWVISAVYSEVGLNFLVHTLSFSISLRVVGSREGEVISEDLSKFFCEGRGELRSAVRYDLFVKSKVGVDFVEEKSGYPFCSGSFLGWAENYPLHTPVVDHDQ